MLTALYRSEFNYAIVSLITFARHWYVLFSDFSLQILFFI